MFKTIHHAQEEPIKSFDNWLNKEILINKSIILTYLVFAKPTALQINTIKNIALATIYETNPNNPDLTFFLKTPQEWQQQPIKENHAIKYQSYKQLNIQLTYKKCNSKHH